MRSSRLLLAICGLGLMVGTAYAQPKPNKPNKSAADKAAREGKEAADKAAAADAAKVGGDKADKPDKDDGNDKKAAAGPQSPNRGRRVKVEYVVAVVNDAIILNSELQARSLPVLAEAQQINDPKERERRLSKLTSQTLDQMVNEELIVQAAEAAKVEVESSEVQAAIDSIKQQNNLDEAALTQALAAQGYTLQAYKQELRRQLLRLRAENQLVAPKVTVSDDDVRARYDQMARRTEQVQAVKLSHMLFKTAEHPTEQQIEAAKAKAVAAMDKVKGGEEFAKVAATESDDDSTKATGGELGWFQRGSMATPEWEPVVFAMDKGDVRGPVAGPQGFHVFTVTEVKRSDLKPFTEMKEQIRGEIRQRETAKQEAVWLEELRKKAYIDIKLQ